MMLVKQIWSYINQDNDEPIFKKALNKSIETNMISSTKTQNKFIFHSKFHSPHEFEIVKEKIILNEKLVKNLTNLILKQLKLSSEILTHNGLEKDNYIERKNVKVETIVYNLVFYKWTENKDEISVLDMAADIMYRIATLNHPFTNGNKRTALLSCGAFLYSVGLYLFFYKTNYLEKWENFIIEVANLKENGYSEKKAINYIKNYIQDFLLINFENQIILYNKEMLIS